MTTNVNFLPIDVDALIERTAQATAELLKGDINPSTDNPNDLLTPKEASNLLRCSITTLWRYDNSGKVKSSTIGGKRLYRRGDLMDVLNSKK